MRQSPDLFADEDGGPPSDVTQMSVIAHRDLQYWGPNEITGSNQ